MSNVRISELNQLTTWTGDDFFPVVDSGSLTTYRTPISSMLTFLAQSGSVISSSWASSSISSSWSRTSSYTHNFEHVKTVSKFLYTESYYSQDMAKVYNKAGTFPGIGNILVSLRAVGDILISNKNYLITCDLYSPGMISDPQTSVTLDGTAYSGYYEVQPLSATRNYASSIYDGDVSLEISQSRGGASINELYFRVRNDTVGPMTASQNMSASLSFWFLDDTGESSGNFQLDVLPNNKILSNRNLPSWPTAFVEIKNYKMTISGSVAVEKEITASLVPVGFVGTASWALGVPGGNMVIDGGSYNISASWASASLSSSVAISSSYASTASFVLSSSYARSASWADRSLTSSYVDISSLLTANPLVPKAWAVCSCTASSPTSNLNRNIVGKNWNNYAILSGYNVSSILRATIPDGQPNAGNGVNPKATYQAGGTVEYRADNKNVHWIVTLTTPLPSLNYTVVGGIMANQPDDWAVMTMFPYAARTTSAFTLSLASGGGDAWNDVNQRNWFSFTVMGT